MDPTSPQPDVYLVGFRANLITAIFRQAVRRRLPGYRGVILIGRSGRILPTTLRVLLQFRFAAFRALATTLWPAPGEVVDASGADDAALERVLAARRGAVFVVCGCDRILRPAHLEQGLFINYHNSLLPGCRGVAAIRWARFRGNPLGFTLHRVEAGIDTGDILVQQAGAAGLRARSFAAISDALAIQAAAALPQALDVALGRAASVLHPEPVMESYHSRRDTAAAIRVDAGTEADRIRAIAAAFEQLDLQLDGGTLLLSSVRAARPTGIGGLGFLACRLWGVTVYLRPGSAARLQCARFAGKLRA